MHSKGGRLSATATCGWTWTFIACSLHGSRNKTSASDPDADGNLGCEDRKNDCDDQGGSHGCCSLNSRACPHLPLTPLSPSRSAWSNSLYSSTPGSPPRGWVAFLNSMGSGTTASGATI